MKKKQNFVIYRKNLSEIVIINTEINKKKTIEYSLGTNLQI